MSFFFLGASGEIFLQQDQQRVCHVLRRRRGMPAAVGQGGAAAPTLLHLAPEAGRDCFPRLFPKTFHDLVVLDSLLLC